MESGHRIFLVGAALLLLGLLVTIPAIFGLNLGLAYVGVGLSIVGYILFILGIHIFLGLHAQDQTTAGTPAPSEDTTPRRLGVAERILIIIVVASLLLTVLLFFIR